MQVDRDMRTGFADRFDRALLIEAESVYGHYAGMLSGIVGITLVATALTGLYYKIVDTRMLAAWLGVIYVLAIVRLWVWHRFRQAKPSPEHVQPWGRRVVIMYGALGITWGAGMIVLYPSDNFPYQLVLPFATMGVCMLSAYAFTFKLSAFYAFVFPAVGLCTVPFFLQGGPLHATLGLVTLTFLPVATRYAHQYHRYFVESVNLRFENLELIENLRREKQTAEDANIAKSRFLAAASHDLRQPMHALGLFVESLEEANLPEAERHTLLNIRRTVDSMEDLFNSLLDISKLDAGVVSVHKVTVPLGPIVEGVVADYRQVAEHKGLRLRIRCPDVFVETDPVLLERILRNLVSNAVQHTQQGSVLVAVRRRGTHARFEVWDTGPGIPRDQQREIFREFYQLKNPERDRRKGLGLGLAIVERLSRLLGHPVELRSRDGKGSMFAVRMPLGLAADWRPKVESRTESAPFDFRGRYIVVVDDEITVQEGMESLLRTWECDVVTAASADEMVAKLSNSTRVPDLIISDYRLRADENGIAVVEHLRGEYNADIPALLITGDTGPERLREAAASRLEILHKPVNPARLRALMSSLLQADRRAAG